MATTCLDKDQKYEEEYLKRFTQKTEFFNFIIQDACIHPSLSDHIVTVSRTRIPDNTNVKQLWSTEARDKCAKKYEELKETAGDLTSDVSTKIDIIGGIPAKDYDKLNHSKIEEEKTSDRISDIATGIETVNVKVKSGVKEKIRDFIRKDAFLKNEMRLDFDSYNEEEEKKEEKKEGEGEEEKAADAVVEDEEEKIEYNKEVELHTVDYEEFTPEIMEKPYQISIWKMSEFGIVRIQDSHINYRGSCKLKLSLSLDRNHIVMSEKTTLQSVHEPIKIMVFDPITLEQISTMEVSVIPKIFRLADISGPDIRSGDKYPEPTYTQDTIQRVFAEWCSNNQTEGQNYDYLQNICHAQRFNVLEDGKTLIVLNGESQTDYVSFSIYDLTTHSSFGEYRLPPFVTRVSSIALSPDNDRCLRVTIHRGDQIMQVCEFEYGRDDFREWKILDKLEYEGGDDDNHEMFMGACFGTNSGYLYYLSTRRDYDHIIYDYDSEDRGHDFYVLKAGSGDSRKIVSFQGIPHHMQAVDCHRSDDLQYCVLQYMEDIDGYNKIAVVSKKGMEREITEYDNFERPVAFTVHMNEYDDEFISMIYQVDAQVKNRFHVNTYDSFDTKMLNKLRTITDVQFRYPFILFLRGSNEMYVYNTINMDIKILKLPTPVVILSRTLVNSSSQYTFYMLLDLGPYLQLARYTDNLEDYTKQRLSIYQTKIWKSGLPAERIKAFYGPMKMAEKADKKNVQESILIHQTESLIQVSIDLYPAKRFAHQKLQRSVKKSEILHFGITFYIFEYNSKIIQAQQDPIKLDDKKSFLTVYESIDPIKHVSAYFEEQSYSELIYIVDELKFVKQLKWNDKEKNLIMDKEYYVSKDFTDDVKHFKLARGVLYQKLQGSVCQIRGREKEEYSTKYYPETFDINQETADSIFPLTSSTWLLYMGNGDENNSDKFYSVMVPLYNDPKVQTLIANEKNKTLFESFHYEDNDYIVYIQYQDYNYDYSVVQKKQIFVKICNTQSQVIDKFPIDIGTQETSYMKIFPSYQGRYFLIIKDIEGAVEENKDKYMYTLFSIEKQVRNKFELKIHKEEKVEKIMGTKADEFNFYNINSYWQFDDTKEFFYIFDEDMSVMYLSIKQNDYCCMLNGVDFTPSLMKSKIIKNDLQPIKALIQNNGVVIYNQKTIEFIELYKDKKTGQKQFKKIKKLDFNVDGDILYIERLSQCKNNNLLMVQVNWSQDQKTSTMMIVWDIAQNKERNNFSLEGGIQHIHSQKSSTGYILSNDMIINMDEGLPNYFFDAPFESQIDKYCNNQALRINEDEDVVLCSGSMFLKNSFVDIELVDEFLSEKEDLTEDNIHLNKVKFQVRGSTALHFYALDTSTLQMILEHFEDNKKEFLTSILMKDQNGKHPLDIAIMNESPKSASIMLKKMTHLSHLSLSHLIKDIFLKLLDMGLPSFNQYIEDCTFRTGQMQYTNVLKMKHKKDSYLIPHSSCLIDQLFKKKYCKRDQHQVNEDDFEDTDNTEKRYKEEVAKIDPKLSPEEKKEKEREITEKLKTEQKEKREENIKMKEQEIKEGKDKERQRWAGLSEEQKQSEINRKKQKRLEIRAIEFDWIFNNEEGKQFLHDLAEMDNIEIFSLTMIRQIIEFMWTYFQSAILKYILIPYVIYFLIFLIYATSIHYSYFQERDNGGKTWDDYRIANLIFLITITIFTFYFLTYEIRQMIFHKLNYFFSFWNLIDLTSLILNIAVIVCDLALLDEKSFIPISATAVSLMWFKVFYFLRIFSQTASLVRMIIEITLDMKWFLLIFLMAVIGFANSFFVIARNTDQEEFFTGKDMWYSMIYSYRTAHGDFIVDGFEYRDRILVYVIWFGHTLIILLVLLNLLIAIMGDTFDRVSETQQQNILKEQAGMMTENEMLINRKKLFKNAKYIFLITEEQADEAQVSWEGKMNQMRKFLTRTSMQKRSKLKEIEKGMLFTIREKATEKTKDMEVSLTKRIAPMIEKLEKIRDIANLYSGKAAQTRLATQAAATRASKRQ